MAESHFATYFHHASVQNAVRAGEIEEFCKGLQPSAEVEGRARGRWQPICDGHVLMSIIASYATLEVSVNELVREGYLQPVRQIREWPKRIFEYFMRKNGLYKSQIILETSDADSFNKETDMVYKNANLVMSLRHYFIHHYPERIDTNEEEPVTDLGGALKTRNFDIDLIWSDEDSIYFPGRCLGFGLAKWCIEAVVDYLEEFEDRLGAQIPAVGRYDIYMSDLDDVK